MKKFLRYVLISSLVSPTVIFLFVKFFAEGRIKAYIESKGSQAVSGQVSLNDLHINFWPPISLIADQLQIKKPFPEIKVIIPKATLAMDLKDIFKGKVIFRVTGVEPKISVIIPEIPAHKPIDDGVRTKTVFGPMKQTFVVGLNVILQKAAISVSKSGKTYSLSQLDADFLAPTVGVPWSIKLATEINFDSPFKISIPTKMFSKFQFDGDVLESNESSLELGGVAVQVKGKSVLSSEDHQWDGQVDIADLKNFPIPPELAAPVKSWSGALKINAHIEHAFHTPWRAHGNLALKSVSVETNIEKPEARIQGLIFTDADVDFNYQDTLVFNKLSASLNFDDCLVSSAQFSKPRGVKLAGNVVADGNQDFFNLTQVSLILNTLTLQAHGRVDNRIAGQSDIQVTIPSTSVEGLERFFPAVASTPLKGRVELFGNIKGDLHEPKNLFVNVSPLTFEKVSGAIAWTSKDGATAVKGVATADGKLVLVAQGQKISQASLNLTSDLTGVAISSKGQFEKKENVPLKLNLRASQKGQTLFISEGQFLIPPGEIALTGSVQDLTAPKLNLNLNFPKLDLGALSKLSPMLQAWKLGGSAHGKLSLTGVYDLKGGITSSPLNLSGTTVITIPHFTYVTKKVAPQGISATPPPATKPEGILPNWPVMRALNLATKISVGSLDYNDLNFQGLSAETLIKNSILTGRVDIKKVFQGSVKLENIETNVLVADSPFATNVSLSQVDLAQALAWGAPQWKEAARGQVSGQGSLHWASKDPSAQGHLEIKKGFLSTVSFDQFLNEKLAHIPGVGTNKPVNTKGTALEVTSTFDYIHSQLFLKNLDAITPEKNELQVSGVIKTDKTLDLRGKAMLTASSLGGDLVSCNADKSGRMVLPLHVSGTMTNPEYNLADGTLQAIIAQTASCQALKLRDQITNRVQDEAKKALSKILN